MPVRPPLSSFRPPSKIETLRLALLSLLEQHEQDGMLPTSGRFLFYELVAQSVISRERTGGSPS